MISCTPGIIIVCLVNESTAGADASVKMPKLHNIKLLIILLHAKIHRVGNDRPLLLLKTIYAKSSSLKLMAALAEPCSSLLTLAATNS